MENNITIPSMNDINNGFQKYGYEATEELQYSTYVGILNYINETSRKGQDIFAVCLEGPPGAGKTEYAKVYTKMVKDLLAEDIEMIEYQCDATTGKTELFEDINISAAIKGDYENVNIPGTLIKAIKKVNDGQKIVLFIDEYDKAREETDAFLLQFLQSGKINSTQHGDLEINPAYKSNLQVILCKNDMRENLSGPLSRRIRIIRLEAMKPQIFERVAINQLIDNNDDPVDKGLIQMVATIYNNIYESSDLYRRIPSCSEMLIVIQDIHAIVKQTNVPNYIVWNMMIQGMLKEVDDIASFEENLKKTSNNKAGNLSKLAQTMKSDCVEEGIPYLKILFQSQIESETQKLFEAKQKYEQLIIDQQEEFEQLMGPKLLRRLKK